MWPHSPPPGHRLWLRGGAGSWGHQAELGLSPKTERGAPELPEFKGRSLKIRLCCSQPRGAPAPSTLPALLGGCPGAEAPRHRLGAALSLHPWGQGVCQHPWVPALAPFVQHREGEFGCRGGGRGSFRALFSTQPNPSAQPWLWSQFGAGWTPLRANEGGGGHAEETGVCSMMVPMLFGR